MNSLPFTYRACFVGCGLTMLMLVGGCSGPASAPGQARESKFEPVIGSVKETKQEVNNSFDTSFLNSNHFACFAINVPAIHGNDQLGDVPWETLEEQLATTLGEANADLSRIDRIWLLADRRGVDFGSPDAPSPLVMIIDYRDPCDRAALDAANQQALAKNAEGLKAEDLSAEEQQKAAARPVILAKAMSDNRVALGSSNVLDSMMAQTGSSRTNLSDQVNQLELTADIEGAISIEPLRDMADQIVSAASRFGGDAMKPWKGLTQSLQSTTVKISLTEPTTFLMQLKLDDPELIDAIAKAGNQNGSNGQAPGGMLGMLGGMGGGANAMGGMAPGRRKKAMVEPTATAIMEQVADEIREEQLFSTTTNDGLVEFKLQRPSKLNELLAASVVDSKRQVDLVQRLDRVRRIKDALQAYHEEHGCLPPRGAVKDHPDGLPDQFNWRVGLLKYLDQTQYERFDFAQALDSEHNRAVTAEVPEAFKFASIDGQVVAFELNSSPEGVYRDEKAPKLLSIEDNPNYTAVVIEVVVPAGGQWYDAKADRLGADTEFGRPNEAGVLMVSASFNVRAVERSRLNAALTIAGGDEVGRSGTISLPRTE